MPQFPFSQALTANQLGFNPLSGWQYEWTPYPCSLLILIRATGNTSKLTLFSGSETIQERTPIQGGGTAGVTPSELNTPAISFMRSEEHTSELQSRQYLVCRLLLEKKK